MGPTQTGLHRKLWTGGKRRDWCVGRGCVCVCVIGGIHGLIAITSRGMKDEKGTWVII